MSNSKLFKQKLKEKNSFWYGLLGFVLVLLIWQLISSLELVARYVLPSPTDVAKAMVSDFPLLMSHTKTTLTEAFIGLGIGILLGSFVALLMDRFQALRKLFQPLIIVSQTIPTVAIAPLLVLWFGYEMLPKVILIVIVTFFPITMGLLEGFDSTDPDEIRLLKSMGATEIQILRYIKFPASLPYFFSGLKLSVSYAMVGAVIAEWLGGFSGLGVYMTRVKKSFAFDKMFAVIILISLISLLLMALVTFIQKKVTPWEEEND